MGSAAESWKHPGRWVAVAAALTAAVIAAIAIAAQNGSNNSRPVYLVLAHPTIRAGGSDTAVVVNRSIYPLNTTGAAISPRTSTRFSLGGHALMWDDPHNSVAPTSRRRILEPSWSTYPPGKYWVWTAYAESSDATLYVHTKLTIVAH